MSRTRDGFRRRSSERVPRATARSIAAIVLLTAVVLGPGASASPAAQYFPVLSGAAGAGDAGPAPAGPAAAGPAAAGGTRVKVVICPTTFGAPSPAKAAPLPRALLVTGTKSITGGLAIFTDKLGRMKLLAPRGWSCSALDAADGSENLVVHPAGTKLTATGMTWALPKASEVKAVVGVETSACVGCQEAQACPLFAAAARDYRSDYGHPCPTRRPRAEPVVPIGPGVVSFNDPAGVRGDGRPSGGRYPANGVMTYYRHSVTGSWLETCVLPGVQKATCTFVLDNFVAQYGKL